MVSKLKILQILKSTNQQFINHWKDYISLMVSISLLTDLILVGVFILLGDVIQNTYQVGFISYRNFFELWENKPFLMLGILLIWGLAVLILYFKFIFVILGNYQISHNMYVRFTSLIKQTFVAIRQAGKALGIFLIYFIALAPLVGLGLRIDLLGRLRFTNQVISLVFSQYWGPVIVAVYLVILYLSIRLIYVYPLMLFKHYTVRRAVQGSFSITEVNQLNLLGAISLLFLVTEVVTLGIFWLIYHLQILVDQHLMTYAKIVVSFNFSLVSLIIIFNEIYLTTMIILIVLHKSKTNQPIDFERPHYPISRWLVLGLLIGYLGVNTWTVNSKLLVEPMVIAHRGVNQNDGVQNTLPAMLKTHQVNPNYVEIDVQETKDHQFVVLHDDNLKQLANQNHSPQHFTLKQLENMTVKEAGHHAKLVSFKKYFAVAKQHHQKLLVELKYTKFTSAQFAKKFMQQYGQQLVKDHDLMHSMNFEAVQTIKSQAPTLKTGYIMSYNLLGTPQMHGDMYTMEYPTLNTMFIMQAHLQHKKVLAWTVDNANDMKKMYFLGVDGIVTNDAQKLNRVLAENHHNYAKRLLNYMLNVQFPIR